MMLSKAKIVAPSPASTSVSYLVLFLYPYQPRTGNFLVYTRVTNRHSSPMLTFAVTEESIEGWSVVYIAKRTNTRKQIKYKITTPILDPVTKSVRRSLQFNFTYSDKRKCYPTDQEDQV